MSRLALPGSGLSSLKNKNGQRVRIWHFFLVGFLVSGGIQSFLVLLGLDFGASKFEFKHGVFDGAHPNDVDKLTLLGSTVAWALSYLLMYFGFIMGHGDEQKIDKEVGYIKEKSSNRGYVILVRDKFSIFCVVYLFSLAFVQTIKSFGFKSAVTDALSNYVYDLRVFVFFLILVVFATSRKKHVSTRVLSLLLSVFLAYVFYAVLTSPQRGFLVMFLFVAGYFWFSYMGKVFSVWRVSLVVVLFVGAFFISTILKFSAQERVQNRTAAVEYATEVFGGPGDALVYTFDQLAVRMNHSQLMYWYLYDVSHNNYYSFPDIEITFLSLVNMFIPGVIMDFSDYRLVNGIDIERWLFFRITGGNDIGGYFVSPMVEALWVSRSYYLAAVIVFVLYFIIGLFFRMLRSIGVPSFPILITLVIPGVFSPESIKAIYYVLFRAGVMAAIIQVYIWGLIPWGGSGSVARKAKSAS